MQTCHQETKMIGNSLKPIIVSFKNANRSSLLFSKVNCKLQLSRIPNDVEYFIDLLISSVMYRKKTKLCRNLIFY